MNNVQLSTIPHTPVQKGSVQHADVLCTLRDDCAWGFAVEDQTMVLDGGAVYPVEWDPSTGIIKVHLFGGCESCSTDHPELAPKKRQGTANRFLASAIKTLEARFKSGEIKFMPLIREAQIVESVPQN